MQAAGTLAQQLVPILEPLQSQIKEWRCRIVPSTCNSADPALRALPLPGEWRWGSLEGHLKRFNPETLILQLPSFWQIEPFVHYASSAVGIPVCCIEPQNYPLDKAAIRLASADAVLAEASEAAHIAEHVSASNIALPPYWVLLHAVDAPAWHTPTLLKSSRIQLAHEVHMAPGVPLLVQCEHLAAQQDPAFHTSEIFTWSSNTLVPTISTKEPMLFKLEDFALPFSLQEHGMCACGKRIVTRVS